MNAKMRHLGKQPCRTSSSSFQFINMCINQELECFLTACIVPVLCSSVKIEEEYHLTTAAVSSNFVDFTVNVLDLFGLRERGELHGSNIQRGQDDGLVRQAKGIIFSSIASGKWCRKDDTLQASTGMSSAQVGSFSRSTLPNKAVLR